MSAMAGASSSADVAAGRVFSGETEDAREYKRWKTWVMNKLLTLDNKVSAAARGAYVYTLLAGKALECVEHLEPKDYQVEGGDKVIFDLLDLRFPQKDVSDEMSETLTEVFGIKATEGETLKVWISRAGELFDRCNRKCKINFPEEARGWLILNRSGLTDEQKAIVLARSGGSLKRDDIGRAMRSCYPEYVVPKRRGFGVGLALVENEIDEDDMPALEQDQLSQEVEAFLAEHAMLAAEEPGEVFDEDEVAEALAVTWKNKRKELTKLQQSRRFGAAQDLRKSYRVEIQELKKKTRCNKCQQVGHWARECPNASQKGKGRGGASHSAGKSSDSGAAYVEPFIEDFVAMVDMCRQPDLSPLEILRQRRCANSTSKHQPASTEVMLVSSPGFGVLDSGCGRAIIGRDTLTAFEQLWKGHGIPLPEPFAEVNHFKFGNGQRETTDLSVRVPVLIAGRSGTIKAAIVRGQAPLLISRSALQTLQAVVNFGRNELTLFQDGVTVPLQTNEAGQYVINVMDRAPAKPAQPEQEFQEVMLNQPQPSSSITECLLRQACRDAYREANFVRRIRAFASLVT